MSADITATNNAALPAPARREPMLTPKMEAELPFCPGLDEILEQHRRGRAALPPMFDVSGVDPTAPAPPPRATTPRIGAFAPPEPATVLRGAATVADAIPGMLRGSPPHGSIAPARVKERPLIPEPPRLSPVEQEEQAERAAARERQKARLAAARERIAAAGPAAVLRAMVEILPEEFVMELDTQIRRNAKPAPEAGRRSS